MSFLDKVQFIQPDYTRQMGRASKLEIFLWGFVFKIFSDSLCVWGIAIELRYDIDFAWVLNSMEVLSTISLLIFSIQLFRRKIKFRDPAYFKSGWGERGFQRDDLGKYSCGIVGHYYKKERWRMEYKGMDWKEKYDLIEITKDEYEANKFYIPR